MINDASVSQEKDDLKHSYHSPSSKKDAINPSNPNDLNTSMQTLPDITNYNQNDNDYMNIDNRHVNNLNINHKKLLEPISIIPRGLLNRGNMCFYNAVLQVLLHCCPMQNLMRLLSNSHIEAVLDEMPFTLAMCQLFMETDILKSNSNASANQNYLKRSMSPDVIYNCIINYSRLDTFQEDAQEFLTFLLDKIHEELLKKRSILRWSIDTQSNGNQSLFSSFSQSLDGNINSNNENFDAFSSNNTIGDINDNSNRNSNQKVKNDNHYHNDNDSGWMQVDKRKRSSHVRTMEHEQSPISFIFFGKFRSILKRIGIKDSITYEPFHCISLDIQDPSTKTIEDAFSWLVRQEVLENQTKPTLKQTIIDSLSPILIIHLKRFIYDPNRGIQKLNKHIKYGEMLTLEYPTISIKNIQETFKLFAVIYHHGKHASGGHYTTHIKSSVLGWLHFDDTTIKYENSSLVLHNRNQVDTYLLFYQRIS